MPEFKLKASQGPHGGLGPGVWLSASSVSSPDRQHGSQRECSVNENSLVFRLLYTGTGLPAELPVREEAASTGR